jgi:hypothetical protein
VKLHGGAVAPGAVHRQFGGDRGSIAGAEDVAVSAVVMNFPHVRGSEPSHMLKVSR